MRLLLLNHNYRFGGTYYRVMPIAEHLAARGHRVTVLTVSRDRRWTAAWSTVSGIRLGEMPNLNQGNSGEGYGSLDVLRRIVHSAANRYDVIHMFDHKPNATFAGFTGRLRRARLVADWADWWGGPGGINDVPRRRIPAIGRFEAWWEVRSKLWADRVTTISTVLRRRALDLGVPADRVLHLPSGAALDRISPVPIGEARRSLGVPLERRMVGFIGMGQGDLEIVMRAQQAIRGLWLMVVGHASPRVLALAREHGTADRLWQTGFVPDHQVGRYLACAEVMAMPMTDRAANRGRLPNKLLDYMAAGRPVVASPVGDVRAIVDTYRTGLLADDTGFAAATARLLEDRDLREECGRNARRAAESDFAWPRLIDRLEALYAGLVGRPGG